MTTGFTADDPAHTVGRIDIAGIDHAVRDLLAMDLRSDGIRHEFDGGELLVSAADVARVRMVIAEVAGDVEPSTWASKTTIASAIHDHLDLRAQSPRAHWRRMLAYLLVVIGRR